MSRTVCSWCKAPLVLKDDILVCSNTDCLACDEKYLHEELIRTRKALDVAVDALKELKPQKAKGGGYWAIKSADAIKLINTTIEQITALKQKDK